MLLADFEEFGGKGRVLPQRDFILVLHHSGFISRLGLLIRLWERTFYKASLYLHLNCLGSRCRTFASS